jgi:hypothetical protein
LQTLRRGFRFLENFIRYGDGSLHTFGYTASSPLAQPALLMPLAPSPDPMEIDLGSQSTYMPRYGGASPSSAFAGSPVSPAALNGQRRS